MPWRSPASRCTSSCAARSASAREVPTPLQQAHVKEALPPFHATSSRERGTFQAHVKESLPSSRKRGTFLLRGHFPPVERSELARVDEAPVHSMGKEGDVAQPDQHRTEVDGMHKILLMPDGLLSLPSAGSKELEVRPETQGVMVDQEDFAVSVLVDEELPLPARICRQFQRVRRNPRPQPKAKKMNNGGTSLLAQGRHLSIVVTSSL